jgi:hypothetical protein
VLAGGSMLTAVSSQFAARAAQLAVSQGESRWPHEHAAEPVAT